MRVVLRHDRCDQDAGIEQDFHGLALALCLGKARGDLQPCALRAFSKRLLTVSTSRISAPVVENTSALPFFMKPAISLFGVSVTPVPWIDTFNTSPGLRASSSRTSLGRTIRPAWSMGISK